MKKIVVPIITMLSLTFTGETNTHSAIDQTTIGHTSETHSLKKRDVAC